MERKKGGCVEAVLDFSLLDKPLKDVSLGDFLFGFVLGDAALLGKVDSLGSSIMVKAGVYNRDI